MDILFGMNMPESILFLCKIFINCFLMILKIFDRTAFMTKEIDNRIANHRVSGEKGGQKGM